MSEPMKKCSRLDEPASGGFEEAFAQGSGRTLEAFVQSQVLRFDNGGQHVVIQGQMMDSSGKESAALVQLQQRAACEDADELSRSLPLFALEATNYSGAEFSFYRATGLGATFDMEVIWPASDRQIQRKTPSEVLLVEEDGELYKNVVESFVQEQATRTRWIDEVVSLQKEQERNLFVNERFVINVDTKWTTHAQPLSVDPEQRKTWLGAKWTDALYLLAIVKDPQLRSLRDLKGEEGAKLCEEMRDELRRAATSIYGVQPSKLRIFFHYHPQFYRLHAHCVPINYVAPGSEVERAHLLTTVAQNLRMGDLYYEKATLCYKVRFGEKLHSILLKNEGGKGLV